MDLNNLIGDLLSQKMVFYGNMLGLGVEYRILDTLMALVLSQ
jgi:hypothetical protein